MAEIDDDLRIGEGTIKSAQDYTDTLKGLIKSLDGVITRGRDQQVVLGDTKSMRKLIEETEKLTKENSELAKTQKSLDTQVKKLEEDNKKLSKSVEDLHKKQKKQKEDTDKLAKSVDTLDEKTGGYIGRIKLLAKELAVLAASPVILALTVIIALLAAAASSVKTFFTSTGEGEDMLARQTAVWNQFFNVLKKDWSDLGKTITDTFAEGSSTNIVNYIFEAAKVLFPFLIVWLKKVQDEFNKTAADAVKLANVLDAIDDRIAANIVKRAETNLKYNELILKSQDDLKYSDEERLHMLEQAITLKKQQLDIDLQIAKDQADALLIEIGLRHSLTEAETKALTEQQKLAIFKGDEMKALAEATANVINLEADYAAEVKKASAKVLALKEEIHKKEVQMLMDLAEARYQAAVDQVEKEINLVRKQVEEGAMLKEEGDKKILALRIQNADNLIEVQIRELEAILALNVLNAEERAKVEKALHDFKIKLSEAQYAAIVEFDAVEIQAHKTKLQVVAELYESFAGSLNQLFKSLSDNRLAELDAQQVATEEYYDNQIRMAGNNTKQKKKLENELEKELEAIEKKRLQQQRRAAIFEKALALIQAAVNVALAATNQGAKGDPYTAFARVGAIVAALGPFIAAIAAKDIPKYEKGGTTKQRTVIAGEKGFERFETPQGDVGFTPDQATVMDLPVGTKITPHDQTLRDLAMSGINPGGVRGSGDGDLRETLDKGFAELTNAVKNKKETQWNVSRRGVELLVLHAQRKLKYLNDKYK